MSVILITTLFYKALILQGELWHWSLSGLKGLRPTTLKLGKFTDIKALFPMVSQIFSYCYMSKVEKTVKGSIH